MSPPIKRAVVRKLSWKNWTSKYRINFLRQKRFYVEKFGVRNGFFGVENGFGVKSLPES